MDVPWALLTIKTRFQFSLPSRLRCVTLHITRTFLLLDWNIDQILLDAPLLSIRLPLPAARTKRTAVIAKGSIQFTRSFCLSRQTSIPFFNFPLQLLCLVCLGFWLRFVNPETIFSVYSPTSYCLHHLWIWLILIITCHFLCFNRVISRVPLSKSSSSQI